MLKICSLTRGQTHQHCITWLTAQILWTATVLQQTPHQEQILVTDKWLCEEQEHGAATGNICGSHHQDRHHQNAEACIAATPLREASQCYCKCSTLIACNDVATYIILQTCMCWVKRRGYKISTCCACNTLSINKCWWQFGTQCRARLMAKDVMRLTLQAGMPRYLWEVPQWQLTALHQRLSL